MPVRKRYKYNAFTDYGSSREDEKARSYDAGGATRNDSGIVPHQQLGTGGTGGGTKYLKDDGTYATPAGSGDVTAAANITDNRLVRGDGGAKGIQQSGITVSDADVLSGGTWQGTAVAAAYGGTGQTSYTIGDLLYASGASALSRLAASTSGYVLTSNGAGAAPSWQAASGGTTSILFAKKAADETRTNSTTITIDGSVQVSLEANTDYAFDAFLVFAAHATPDYKFGLIYPASCTVDWNHTGDANGATIATETVVVTGVGAGITTWKRHHVAGIVRNGANAGTFGIGWAQNTLDAVNGAAIRQGSWMRLQKT